MNAMNPGSPAPADLPLATSRRYAPEVQRIPASDHCISPGQIPSSVRRILERLSEAGYAALLVGGCVRDLLLGEEPHDFDIATDARPEQVKGVFRNARLIGRRFRLAHVRAGRLILEVSTFRGQNAPREDADAEEAPEEDAPWRTAAGRVLSDNVYGTREDDALRRDLTINALYYDHVDGSVIDDVGGVEDLRRGVVRVIGDPEQRYREDPVRMLRALRVAARFGFSLDPDTAEPIRTLSPLLSDIPPARLYEEVLKLLQRGYAAVTLDLLRNHGVYPVLFPATARTEATDASGRLSGLIDVAMESTDARVRSDRPVNPAFLFAILMWAPFRERLARLREAGLESGEAFQIAADEVIAEQCAHIAIPRRISAPVGEIWVMQERLERRRGKRLEVFLAHRRFRAAYDFLLMRAAVGEVPATLGEWWTRIQDVDADERREMAAALPGAGRDRGSERGSGRGAEGGPGRKRRRRRRGSRPAEARQGAVT